MLPFYTKPGKILCAFNDCYSCAGDVQVQVYSGIFAYDGVLLQWKDTLQIQFRIFI